MERIKLINLCQCFSFIELREVKVFDFLLECCKLCLGEAQLKPFSFQGTFIHKILPVIE